jgi:two-component system, LytTR family, response regulator
MLNVLIVDDESLAHDVLLHHCAAHPDVRIVGQCYNAAEALAAIAAQQVDLLLLDVRMPRFGGLDLLRGLDAPPMAIIVSAHREHALDGYDLDVVDYLLKPVSAERLAAALDKVRRRLLPKQSPDDADIVLKVDRAFRRFRLDHIACFEAEGNFVRVWGDGVSCLATVTLRRLEEILPHRRFRRVHKSYLVNLDAIAELRSGAIVLVNGMTVPIGRAYRQVTLLSPHQQMPGLNT